MGMQSCACLDFFNYFFLIIFYFGCKRGNQGTEALQGAWASCWPLAYFQDVLAMAFRCPPAAEGLGRSLDKNRCLVGLIQDELEN